MTKKEKDVSIDTSSLRISNVWFFRGTNENPNEIGQKDITHKYLEEGVYFIWISIYL